MNKQLLGIIVLLIGNLLFTISTIFIKTLDIGFIYLNDKDVVRHDLVRQIINAYEKT